MLTTWLRYSLQKNLPILEDLLQYQEIKDQLFITERNINNNQVQTVFSDVLLATNYGSVEKSLITLRNIFGAENFCNFKIYDGNNPFHIFCLG